MATATTSIAAFRRIEVMRSEAGPGAAAETRAIKRTISGAHNNSSTIA